MLRLLLQSALVPVAFAQSSTTPPSASASGSAGVGSASPATADYPIATLLLQGNASEGFVGALVHATSCKSTYVSQSAPLAQVALLPLPPAQLLAMKTAVLAEVPELVSALALDCSWRSSLEALGGSCSVDVASRRLLVLQRVGAGMWKTRTRLQPTDPTAILQRLLRIHLSRKRLPCNLLARKNWIPKRSGRTDLLSSKSSFRTARSVLKWMLHQWSRLQTRHRPRWRRRTSCLLLRVRVDSEQVFSDHEQRRSLYRCFNRTIIMSCHYTASCRSDGKETSGSDFPRAFWPSIELFTSPQPQLPLHSQGMHHAEQV